MQESGRQGDIDLAQELLNCPPEEERLRFLLKVLQSIIKSKGNPQVVYPLLQQNLALLDDVTIDVLKDWVSNKFAQAQRDAQRSISIRIAIFGDLMQQFHLGNKAVNIDLSIACYQIATEIFTATEDPEIWAMIQNNLANVYLNRTRENIGENLELSIQFYTSALKIRTKEDFPSQWAMTQTNLGLVYTNRIEGNRAENLELSIQCYKSAVEVYTKEDFPIQWADIQNNLANAYLNRIRENREENLELSIQYCISASETIVEVRNLREQQSRFRNIKNWIARALNREFPITKDNFSILWASIHNNLGNAYLYRIEGNRSENLELSIECYKSALEIFNMKDFPNQWALTQNNLGNAYLYRIEGNRSENLELSIECYKSALKLRTRAYAPMDWALTQNNLANAYSERIGGDRAENLELSIQCCVSALEVFTKQDFPIQWADTQLNLAAAYLDRIKEDKRENLELSIQCYKSALDVREKKDFPINWAAIQLNLANAYSKRIGGDRADNIEQSIHYCASALEVYTKNNFPIQWAMIQNNLGNAYLQRIGGNKEENLKLSIYYYTSALDIRTKDDFPIDWAATQLNLANAYLQRIGGDKEENLELSIYYCVSALEIYTEDNFPIPWAMTQNSLGFAYARRNRGHREENLEQSIYCFVSALKICTKEALPIDWAMTQNNLGFAYSNRIRGVKAENLQQSIACYEASLEINTSQNLPIACLQSARSLGDIYFNQGNWQEAISNYETAMQAAETSRSWSVNDQERQRVLTEALSVYENAIQCTVNLKDYKRAIAYTERIRSRQLVELIASKDLYSDAQVPAEIQAYLAEYQQLNQEVDNLRDSGEDRSGITKTRRTSQDFRKSSEKIAKVEERKQILYNQIRTYDPVLAGQIAVAPISHGEIQQLITSPHTAILTFYSTNDDTHIFILKHDREPELFTCKNQGKKELLQWLIANWRDPYQKNTARWLTKMPEVLAEIATRLQLPQLIANHLSGIQELVLVPHLLLHQIPFAALPILGSEQLLGEKFTIRCIPSCQILQYCQQRPPINANIQGIVEDADDSLMGARYEGQKIAEIYRVSDSDRLRGKTQATVANYRQLLSRVNRIHSSHHASSNLNNPLESALQLADGKITLGDLLLGERYQNLDEIFLSACETHVGEYTFTDDVTTITTGFLCIGARSVQSTLWSVDDLVTAIFDVFYHQERREGFNRAVSLKRAQVRLRYLSGEEFRINHYPELKQFLDKFLPNELDRIDQKIEQLEIIMKTLTGNDEGEISRELQQLENRYKYLATELKPLLNDYCKQAYPFAAPYYWAGFICQGMA